MTNWLIYRSLGVYVIVFAYLSETNADSVYNIDSSLLFVQVYKYIYIIIPRHLILQNNQKIANHKIRPKDQLTRLARIYKWKQKSCKDLNEHRTKALHLYYNYTKMMKKTRLYCAFKKKRTPTARHALRGSDFFFAEPSKIWIKYISKRTKKIEGSSQ